MSKNSLARFPSVRTNLQRKESKQAALFVQTKEDLAYIDSDKKLHETQPLSSTQNQVSKKIQNKLRMRKPSGSDKKLKQSVSGKDLELGSQTRGDFACELREQIENLFQNSQAVYDTIVNSGMSVSGQVLKQQMVKESSLIICQLSKGLSLQNIVVQKLQRKLNKLKCIKKCEQKEKSVNWMFEDRLQKLSMVLRTR